VKRSKVRRSSKTASDGKVQIDGSSSLSTGSAVDHAKLPEDMLREEIREWRQIFDAIPSNIGVLDAAGEILYVNRTALDHMGLTLEEVRIASIRERTVSVYPEDWERYRNERGGVGRRPRISGRSEITWERRALPMVSGAVQADTERAGEHRTLACDENEHRRSETS
jgi:PAS domain S-box-containing protein